MLCRNQFQRFVVTDEQRSESDSLSLRIGVPGDHEFLLVEAFELQPVARSRGEIRTVGVLGNDPFPTFAASFAEVSFAFGFALFREAQRVLEVQRLRQQFLAFAQWQLAHIAVIEAQKIERIEPHWDFPTKFFRRVLELHSLLQFGEARDLPVESHDFSVYGKRIRFLRAKSLD